MPSGRTAFVRHGLLVGARFWRQRSEHILVGYSFTRLSRSAFMTTVKDDNAIAAPANIGDIRMPETVLSV